MLLTLAATGLRAQGAAPAAAVAGDEAPSVGSPTFCLFELPPVNERRQWLNLVHVQYIELRSDELRLYYGGGNLGSGHEARLPIRNKDDAPALLKRLQEAARACR
jgi:hypothetical protein